MPCVSWHLTLLLLLVQQIEKQSILAITVVNGRLIGLAVICLSSKKNLVSSCKNMFYQLRGDGFYLLSWHFKVQWVFKKKLQL